MSEFDRNKWNKKYKEKPALLEERPPSPMVKQYFQEAVGQQALDLACGNGRNTLFLAQQGFHVDAVDISSLALDNLRQKSQDLNITLHELDLDTFTPKENTYDLALMTNYLDRALILRTAKMLKPKALFIIETYMEHPENEKKDSNPGFLLQKEELKTFFDDNYTLLAYHEFWNEDHEIYKMMKQAIVVQKN
jgi:SAM-dependent methyltransferase